MDEENFVKACNKVEKIYTRLNSSTIRKIYAYYKQATEGDVFGKRPGVLKLRDRIKYDSWASISGMSEYDAKIAYIKLANDLEFEEDD